MRLLKSPWVRAALDILHDLAAGAWPGAVAALALARAGAERYALGPEQTARMLDAWSGIWPILFLSLATLAATGGARLHYRALGIRPDGLPVRTRAALIKHAAFAVTILGVTVAAFILLRP
jgi:hypothetical protein